MEEQKKQLLRPKIYYDHRERKSGVVAALENLGAELIVGQETDGEETECLSVGDYVCSDRVGIERKATDDILKSHIDDRKFFNQVFDLMRGYKRPVLIVEGIYDELFTSRMISGESLWGVLETIAVSYRVPTLYTLNPRETANCIYNIAYKEQKESKGAPFHPHGKRSSRGPDEQLVYTITSLQDMGVVTGKNLLHHFKTIKNIVNADKEELEKVPLVGEKTSKNLISFFNREYKK